MARKSAVDVKQSTVAKSGTEVIRRGRIILADSIVAQPEDGKRSVDKLIHNVTATGDIEEGEAQIGQKVFQVMRFSEHFKCLWTPVDVVADIVSA